MNNDDKELEINNNIDIDAQTTDIPDNIEITNINNDNTLNTNIIDTTTNPSIDNNVNIIDNNLNPSSISNINTDNNISNQESINNNPSSNKKNNKRIITVIILLILITIGVIFGIKIFKSDKKIVESEITEIFKIAKDKVKEANKRIIDFDIDKDNIGFNGVLTFDSDYKNEYMDLTKLKNYNIKYEGAFNKKDNELSLNVSLDKDKTIVSGDMYGSENNLFLYLKDIYEKTINFELDSEIKDIKISKVKEDDIEKLINKTENITKDYLKGKEISNRKEKRKILDKEKEYNIISYIIDNNEFTTKLYEEFRNDKEILEIISNLLNKEIKETDKFLKEEIANTKKYTRNNTELTINTYTDGLLKEIKEIEIIDENLISTIDIDKDKYIIKEIEKEDKKEVLSGEVNKNLNDMKFETYITNYKNEVDTTSYNINISDSEKIKMSIKVDTEHYKYNVEVTNTSKKEKDEQKNTTDIKFDYDINGEKYSFTVNNVLDFNKNGKVKEMDTKNSIKSNELNEEAHEILEKLGKKLDVIYKDIVNESIYNNNSTDYYDSAFFRKILPQIQE